MSMLAYYDAFVAVVRVVLLYLAIAIAAICVFDWGVRTRRISPFNRAARFFRARIDPVMAPVERAVVRRGGLPTQAPWWSLAAVVVGGILLISLLGLIGSLLVQVIGGIYDPRRIPWILLSWVFSLLKLALLVRVLTSWLPISPYSKWVRWSFVLTEWMIRPLQRIVPKIGMIDITPLVAWLLLNLLEGFILG
ncbi:MAG TPA: YggT family protein [Gemmatimonadaceae bacterium]|jgi:YggT family protein